MLPGFTGDSVTFVSDRSGWVLGGGRCETGRGDCLGIARTRDGGRTWKGLPAPRGHQRIAGGLPEDQLRFGDLLNGFAFGQGLVTTHDGGGHWKRTPLTGAVASLEVGHGQWWAIVSGCYEAAVACAKAGRVLTGRLGSDVSTTVRELPPQVTGQVVLHGAAVFLALHRQDGQSAAPALVASTGGPFATREMPCDDSEVPYLAAAGDTSLSLVCESLDAGAGQQGKRFFSSASSGRSWSGHAKPAQIVGTTVAATGSATFVGNSRTGVEVTRDGGASWADSLRTDAGISYVGFTSGAFGQALAGDGLLLTRDAGRTWQQVAF